MAWSLTGENQGFRHRRHDVDIDQCILAYLEEGGGGGGAEKIFTINFHHA